MVSSYKNLSIRSKIIIVIIISILIFATTLYVVSKNVLSRSYTTIEQQSSLKDLSRVHDALDNIISQLQVKLSDWAAWDDTYEFIQDHNEDYVTSNLGVPSIAMLRINTMVFSDVEGKVLFIRTIDIDREEEVDSTEMRQFIEAHREITIPPEIGVSTQGIISLPQGPMIFVTQPVTMSDRSGPVKGSITFGAFLDTRVVTSLASLTHLSVGIYPYGDTTSPAEVIRAEEQIHELKDVFTDDDLGTVIHSYHVLYDFFNEPALTLRVESPRDISHQGKLALYTFTITTSILVFVFGLILIILLEHLVIGRFIELSGKVHQIADTNDLSLRVDDSTRDEIGTLASAINHMVEKISVSVDAEKKAREEAYGVNEELKRNFDSIDQMNKTMVNRELKMIELKEENERLRKGETVISSKP